MMRVACVLLLLARLASADPAPDDTPWGRGVSEERKATAQKLLEAGNDLLLQNQYRDALDKYQQAVAAWDHPAIRFNMVRALISLDRAVEAADNLDKALAYGAAPLEETIYREALNYKRLLAAQLPMLQITCKQEGVRITVDGAEFLSCPGTKTARTTPGSHAIVGAKAGFLPRTFDDVLLPGKQHPIEITLVPLGEAVTRTRWAPWKPWAVAGGGAALVGAGVFLELAARGNNDDYDKYLRNCPAVGCAANDPTLASTKSRAELESRLAVGSLIVGGAAVTAGVVLLVMNRPYAFVPETTHGSIGISAVGRF